MNTYNFVDCVYISLYWIYTGLLDNYIGNNVLTFISNINEPHDKFINNYLEFTMLRIVIDDKCNKKTIIDNYINEVLNDDSFIVIGIDINEIEQELEQYNITNNRFISNIKTRLSETTTL